MVCEACSQQGNMDARFCCHCGKPMTQHKWNSFAGRLVRPPEGRMIAGVCMGLSQAYGLDPVLVRILALVGLFSGFGTVAIAYLAAWIVMPNATLYGSPVPPVSSAPGYAGGAPGL